MMLNKLTMIAVILTGACVSLVYSHVPPLVIKDGRLDGLARLLNSDRSQKLFRNWKGTVNESMNFLELLEPWLLSDNMDSLFSKSFSTKLPLQCENPTFSQVLTGRKMPDGKERMIVDFVPFGYDVDKLLVRFHESWEFVDAFVVYEMPFTLLGHPKALFYERVKKQERFRRFVDKVIYITPDLDGLQKAVYETKDATSRYFKRNNIGSQGLSDEDNSLKTGSLGQRGTSSYLEPALYSVMRFFNADLVRQFMNIGAKPADNSQGMQNIALKEMLMQHMQSGGAVYAIQNDGDEFVKGSVLRHIRHCELKADVLSIYTPCFGFKNNYHWLQTTFDMRGFSSGQESRTTVDSIKWLKVAFFGPFFGKALEMELNKYIWRLGPFLWPLEEVLGREQLLRRNFTTDRFFNHHMGYGAATHMSGVNDPVELWYKACGTVEMLEACINIVPAPIRAAAARGGVTPALIYAHTIFPWCHLQNKAVHVRTLSRRAQRIVKESIPWVVRNNPSAFPFMFPVPGLSSVGLFEKAARPEWAKVCGYEPVGLVDT